jgi:uncharacterized membrane protein YciS (DUF1049 family)
MAAIFLVMALIIAILAVIFALQNAGVVTVAFFASNLEGSLALVLLITFAVGVIVGILLVLPYLIRRSLKVRNLSRRIQETEKRANEGELEDEDEANEYNEV